MVYNGLNESPMKWVGQLRYFDVTGDLFDIKPVFHLILSCDPSYTFCTLICVLDFHGLMKQDSDF